MLSGCVEEIDEFYTVVSHYHIGISVNGYGWKCIVNSLHKGISCKVYSHSIIIINLDKLGGICSAFGTIIHYLGDYKIGDNGWLRGGVSKRIGLG